MASSKCLLISDTSVGCVAGKKQDARRRTWTVHIQTPITVILNSEVRDNYSLLQDKQRKLDEKKISNLRRNF